MADDTRSKLIEMKRQLAPKDLLEAELKAAFTSKPAALKKFKGRMARLKGMKTSWEPYKKQIEAYTAKKIAESKDLPDKIARLTKIVKAECAHPTDSLEVHEHYYAAEVPSETAYTEYYVKCKLCGKTGPVTTKEHTHYG